MLGILLIDKPKGISSHDAVNTIRRKFSTKRVGHAGTLDPAATGLLVIAVGPATRFLQYLPLEPKEYVGEVTFGIATTTQDSEGTVVEELPVPDDLEGRLSQILPQFHGLISQVPPMYSAVKKGGRPLYTYARKGEEVARAARTIHIDRILVERLNPPRAVLRVVCSGGTYLRTLAEDIGIAIGCGAYLSTLNRERVGDFLLGEAVALEEAGPANLINLRDALGQIPMVDLAARETADIREGRAISANNGIGGPLAGLIGADGQVIGIARVQGNVLQPECVIPIEITHGSY